MGRNAPLAAAACMAMVASCEAQDAAAPAPQASASSVLPQLPVVDPPLDREALLMAVIRAASEAATGDDLAENQRRLEGKQFELRLRFGCPDESEGGNETRNWSFDEERRVVRVEIRPEIVSDTPLVEELAGRDFEAAEGFWIRRPWLLQTACLRAEAASPLSGRTEAREVRSPSRASGAARPDPTAAQIGIAQFFTAADARTHRRDSRAYQVTKTLAQGEKPSSDGYDLIIRGRLQRLPHGRVIGCRSNGVQQPSCIVSARFEEVSLERADTGELLAEWPSG